MEQIATVYYGCGIHVTDVKFIKPEYHPTISGAWIQALQKLNSHILETSNNVNENYYSIESLYLFTALLKQRISYLDIKTFEILTDGSVEF